MIESGRRKILRHIARGSDPGDRTVGFVHFKQIAIHIYGKHITGLVCGYGVPGGRQGADSGAFSLGEVHCTELISVGGIVCKATVDETVGRVICKVGRHETLRKHERSPAFHLPCLRIIRKSVKNILSRIGILKRDIISVICSVTTARRTHAGREGNGADRSQRTVARDRVKNRGGRGEHHAFDIGDVFDIFLHRGPRRRLTERYRT